MPSFLCRVSAVPCHGNRKIRFKKAPYCARRPTRPGKSFSPLQRPRTGPQGFLQRSLNPGCLHHEVTPPFHTASKAPRLRRPRHHEGSPWKAPAAGEDARASCGALRFKAGSEETHWPHYGCLPFIPGAGKYGFSKVVSLLAHHGAFSFSLLWPLKKALKRDGPSTTSGDERGWGKAHPHHARRTGPRQGQASGA